MFIKIPRVTDRVVALPVKLVFLTFSLTSSVDGQLDQLACVTNNWASGFLIYVRAKAEKIGGKFYGDAL